MMQCTSLSKISQMLKSAWMLFDQPSIRFLTVRCESHARDRANRCRTAEPWSDIPTPGARPYPTWTPTVHTRARVTCLSSPHSPRCAYLGCRRFSGDCPDESLGGEVVVARAAHEGVRGDIDLCVGERATRERGLVICGEGAGERALTSAPESEQRLARRWRGERAGGRGFSRRRASHARGRCKLVGGRLLVRRQS
jgi:hypothetical protein